MNDRPSPSSPIWQPTICADNASALALSAESESTCNASLQLHQQPIRAQNCISREKSTERNIIERYNEYS